MNYITYLLLSQFAIALLYIVYKVVYARDTFLQGHRVLLVGGIIFALLYPFLPTWNDFVVVPAEWQSTTDFVAALPSIVVAPTEAVGVSLITILGWIYIAGVAVGIIRLVVRLVSLALLKARCNREILCGEVVYVAPVATAPFSFFNAIFVSPDSCSSAALQDVLIHERAHVRQCHTCDLLLSECMLIMGWFNPFTWLLCHEVRMCVECLADAEALQHTASSREYQLHLLQVSVGTRYQLGASFNRQSLKHRIAMINRCASSPLRLSSYLLLLPLAVGLLFIVQACKGGSNKSDTIMPVQETFIPEEILSDSIYNSCEVMPEYPGGMGEMMGFVSKNLQYPAEAKEAGVQGAVVVQFVVDKTGKITSPKVLKGLSPECDAEVLRVVSLMPQWNPGMQDDEAVNVKFTLPVMFQLP